MLIFSLIASEALTIPQPISTQVSNFVASMSAKSYKPHEAGNTCRVIYSMIQQSHHKDELLNRMKYVQIYMAALPSGSDFDNYVQVALHFMQRTQEEFISLIKEMSTLGKSMPAIFPSSSSNGLQNFLHDPYFQDKKYGIDNFLDMLEGSDPSNYNSVCKFFHSPHVTYKHGIALIKAFNKIIAIKAPLSIYEKLCKAHELLKELLDDQPISDEFFFVLTLRCSSQGESAEESSSDSADEWDMSDSGAVPPPSSPEDNKALPSSTSTFLGQRQLSTL